MLRIFPGVNPPGPSAVGRRCTAFLQTSMRICASCSELNSSMFSNSSWTWPLNDSTYGILPRRAEFDGTGGGASQAAPVAQRPGDHLRAIVHPQRCWRAAQVTTASMVAPRHRLCRSGRPASPAPRGRSSTMFSRFSRRRSAVSSNWEVQRPHTLVGALGAQPQVRVTVHAAAFRRHGAGRLSPSSLPQPAGWE